MGNARTDPADDCTPRIKVTVRKTEKRHKSVSPTRSPQKVENET